MSTVQHWESGVVGQCDRCGQTTILHAGERDYMDEPTELVCRPCWFGLDDDDETDTP